MAASHYLLRVQDALDLSELPRLLLLPHDGAVWGAAMRSTIVGCWYGTFTHAWGVIVHFADPNPYLCIMAWKSSLSKTLQELRSVRLARLQVVLPMHAPLLKPTSTTNCRVHICQTGPASQGARCVCRHGLCVMLRMGMSHPLADDRTM